MRRQGKQVLRRPGRCAVEHHFADQGQAGGQAVARRANDSDDVLANRVTDIGIADLVANANNVLRRLIDLLTVIALKLSANMAASSVWDGYSTLTFKENRSTWASGRAYTPSCSTGFCVARTQNGSSNNRWFRRSSLAVPASPPTARSASFAWRD